jgi:tetratricopeptide (TPR) repeat protein
MKKPRLVGVGVSVLVLAVAGGGVWWMRADEARAVASAAVPARPALHGWPQELREQIAVAEEDARSLIGAGGGLGRLARLYHANGFHREAVRCYEALAWIEPDEPRWPHRHATILAGFGELDQALVKARRVVELAPDYVPGRLRLADLLLKANQPPAASAEYGEILRIQPDEPYAQLGLARVAFEAGQWEQARQRLEPLVAQTNFLLGYDLIVTVYERLGLNERAAQVLGQGRASGAFRDAPDPWVDELMDDCYDTYRLGVAAGAAARAADSDTALRMLERAVAIKPGDVSSVFQLGSLHRERKEYSSARLRFDECTRLAPDFADGWAHLSALLAQLNDAAGAERALSEGLRRCPDSPGLHLMRARNLVEAGRRAEAVEAYRRSIRYRSNEAAAFIELGRLLFGMQRVDEGLAAMKQALEAEPEHPDALGVFAFHAISTGDEARARSWLTRIRNQPRVPREQVERLLGAYQEKFGRPF